MTYKILVCEYIKNLREIYELTQKLVKLPTNTKENIDYLHTSAIVNMCIRFESFTVDIYSYVFHEKEIAFNVP